MNEFIRLVRTVLLVVVIFLLPLAAVNCSDDDTETVDSIVNWLYDWDEALGKAQDENKPIMIDFHAEWCQPCKLLDFYTYSDAELGAFINDTFICVKSNIDENNLYQNYSNITGIPTIIFASSDGTEFGRMSGFREPDQYYEDTQEILSQWES